MTGRDITLNDVRERYHSVATFEMAANAFVMNDDVIERVADPEVRAWLVTFNHIADLITEKLDRECD